MALKEEKAQSMFNKWAAMKRALYVRDPDAPPPLVEECSSLKECYRWRETIMKEVGDKVAEIQNAGLGDFRIRALNDEINKLLNHKRMWEGRIRQLGGPDFRTQEARFFDSEGVELPGSGGYKYFGAAKDLPGVRELFFREAPPPPEKNLEELMKGLDDEYFGKTPMSPKLIENIRRFEDENKSRMVEQWLTNNFKKVAKSHPNINELDSEEILRILTEEDFESDEETEKFEQEKIMEKEALEKKKKELLRVYVGEIEGDHEKKEEEAGPLAFTEEY